MIEQDKLTSASKGPKKRDPVCLQTQYPITIPAGTILRQEPGKADTFACPFVGGEFVIDRAGADAHEVIFKRVIA